MLFLEKTEGGKQAQDKVLITIIKRDVHDIGKNLVDIILTNNDYEVINLDIKQDVTAIINAQKEHHTDCICMSGLLVKAIAFMKDNLGAFNNVDIQVPVILGGAALPPVCPSGLPGDMPGPGGLWPGCLHRSALQGRNPSFGSEHQEEGANRCRGSLAWAWRSYPMDSAETPPSLQKSEEKRSLRE